MKFQGCQVYTIKPAQLILKISSKLAYSGGKTRDFLGGFAGKNLILGAKYQVAVFASLHGHETTTRGTSDSSPDPRERAHLATLVHAPARAPRPCSAASETPSRRRQLIESTAREPRRPPFYIIGNQAELRRGVIYRPRTHTHTDRPQQTRGTAPGKRAAAPDPIPWRFVPRRPLFDRCLETMCGSRGGRGLPDTLNTLAVREQPFRTV